MSIFWKFKTANFKITMEALPEDYLDLSWDDTGEVREGLESGLYVAFCAKCTVYYKGAEIAADYLGNCIYESADAFRDHVGIKAQGPNIGSYFSDMVRTAIAEARKVLSDRPYIRAA